MQRLHRLYVIDKDDVLEHHHKSLAVQLERADSGRECKLAYRRLSLETISAVDVAEKVFEEVPRPTLVLMMRRRRGVRIIATSEVEKSISIMEISPAAPLSESGVWKTRANGSVA